MIANKPLLIMLVLFLASCSFKHNSDLDKQNQDSIEVKNLDSDGDGILDLLEDSRNGAKYIANIPVFTGDLFQEFKLTTTLYNMSNHAEENISFQVRKDLISENGISFEDRDYLSNSNQFLFEQSARLAKLNSYWGFHLPSEVTHDQLSYYSAPRMNNLKTFPYSKRLVETNLTHEFEEIQMSISSQMSFEYDSAVSYSDVSINLYWFNDKTNSFEIVGSQVLEGVYKFNKNYNIPLSFTSKNKNLVRSISLNAGRFLYLRIIDFRIIESNKFYNQLLSSVSEKSIPLMVKTNELTKLIYVGLNGKTATLETILNKANIGKIQIRNSSVVRVGDTSNVQALEENLLSKGSFTKKWYLLTNEINSNPTTYSFSPQDVLSLSYISKENSFDLIPTYFGSIIDSTKPQTIKTIILSKSNFSDLRINIKPEFVTAPINTMTSRVECFMSSLSKRCFDFKNNVKTLKGIDALLVSSLLYLNINNHEFRLDKLIEQKKAFFKIQNSDFIEIRLSEDLLQELPASDSINLAFSIRPTNLLGCDGLKYCESVDNECFNYLTTPSCEVSTMASSYVIKDLTTKTLYPVIGRAFLSLEYI